MGAILYLRGFYILLLGVHNGTTMKLKITPPTKKDKKGRVKKINPRLSSADTALEFRFNEIIARAFHRSFGFELLDKTEDHVEIIVTDGRRRQNRVQYFNRNRTISCCSCEEFIKDECRFCVHLAAVENVLKYPMHYRKQDANYGKWCATFRARLIRIPTSVKQFNQHYTFWDPYKSTFYTFGRNKPTKETVATKTFKKLQRKKKQKMVTYLPEPIDKGLLKGVTLYDYQQDVFRNMLKAQRAICSMIMGAGKTLTTIACYAFIDKHKPDGNASMLVIGPKSLRYQWGSEIERTCDKKVFQVEKPAHIPLAMNEDINVMTYQFLTRHVDKFAKRKYDIIIVDEIQYIRNSKTKTWKAISKLKSDFFFGLSGTVIENRLDDLYSIMEIINPGVLGPKWKFDDQFQELQIKSRAKWVYKGFKNLDQLKELLKGNVFSYDKLSLPPIQHHNVFVAIGRDQAALHDEFYTKAKELIAKSLNGPVSHHERLLVQALLLKSRQVGNTKELITKKREQPSQKVAKFLELVEKICVKQNEKLVVFSDWVEMLEICDRFAKQKYKLKSAFFTGKQNSKQREKAVEDFQNDPDCMIFFASDAGGIGLDGLQLASSNVIHVELPWNPAKLDQRTGRVHRLLQKNNVDIYYLISKDTIEEKIFSLIQEKKQVRVQTLAEFHV